ncbi:hypothetical protein HWQ46_18145 [Shewanella sp. D64]|uniref:hypothetical protein n=1 Tax=unclassified Shewanella TaxID=196818 RepID=UPI0022BA3584|nr:MULTISPECIES: hypothetical protein [unclassified Shewanella]MEC4727469.1 hypothetical protein [Shewanella sp. D64]MEC4738122.1 hypothetical protein [Shewanella sp. E94]WBJ96365.1 hypothetical protein HWQ47_04365 [Shewanella sp. MTB7]
MSSPIGGFYLNAQYKRQADKFEIETETKLELSLQLLYEETLLIDTTKPAIVNKALLIENERCSIILTPSLISENLIQIHSLITINHLHSTHTAQQIITIEFGEQLTTLVEGDSKIQLTLCAKLS